MSPNKRIFLNTIATYGRSLYALVCGLLISRWVLAALGKTDFGLYGVVGGMTVFISFFNSILNVSTSRFYAYAEGSAQKLIQQGRGREGIEECRQWFSTALLMHTTVPLLMMIIGYPLGMYAVEHWLTIPPERLVACRWVFRFVCISCFVAMINVPFQAMFTAKQLIAELTIYSFVQTTLNVVFIYFMATHPRDWLIGYACWVCVVSTFPQIIICMRAITVFPECRFSCKYAFNLSHAWQLLSYAFWQVFSALGAILRGQGVQILINKYYNPAYNASMSIANQVAAHTQTLSSAMIGAFNPVITAACGAGEFERMRTFAYRSTKLGILFALIIILPFALELRTVLNIWLGCPPPYVAELCWCVLFCGLIEKVSSGHMLAVSACGKVAAYLAFSGGSLMLTLPLAWLLVASGMNFPFVGVAMVLTMILCACGRIWFARRLVGMGIRNWLYNIALPAFFVASLSFGIGYCTRFWVVAGLLRIVITTLVCEVIFFPMAWFIVLSKEERQYVVMILMRIVKR